ncbi:E3 ubiquitin-protein ligase RNF43 [Rosa sericea]
MPSSLSYSLPPPEAAGRRSPSKQRQIKYLYSQVSQGGDGDGIQIKFVVQTSRGSCWVGDPNAVVYGQFHLKGRSTINDDDLSSRPSLSSKLGRKLSGWGVPQPQQATILEQVFRVLEKAKAVVPVAVTIQKSTVFIFDSLKDHQTMVEHIKKTDSEHFEGLGKVTSIGDIIPPPSCSICLEGVSQAQAQSGGVARLPCSHIYHKNCILPWLKKSHLCPICRHPGPISQAQLGKPSEPCLLRVGRRGWWSRLWKRFRAS